MTAARYPPQETCAMITIALPTQQIHDRLAQQLTGANVIVWGPADGAPPVHIHLALLGYLGASGGLKAFAGMDVAALQSQSLGYDGVEDRLPAGITYCNAIGVHEASTAELAVGMIISEQRGFPQHFANQQTGTWDQHEQPGVAGKTVVIVGAGGVGNQIADKLAPFDANVVRVARTNRSDARGAIQSMDALPALLGRADIAVIAVPLSDETTKLVDAAFLESMKPGALLVNVSRGKIVDTDALVAAASAGHVRAALDVTDPEPLPSDHPLWSTPGVTITPHIGGATSAMHARVDAVMRDQTRRLVAGEPLANVVIDGR
ncbi:NAD(P)-dependent oxidoreductase [Salinibacterium sp. NK8237]|uniref:NAD(P)-dependent oxidoreductase n=1 Tax=Salinibacterium sp. NK8237 TaxID=2792038 RepID=UPI0018CD0016|nr:NAD(P)-dependent oxidoreductase [Salinibacterium sp. NK8237]MBH0130663.1 hydroxyacid dehydrogenase [Salinibacterium sp. NK8237]